MSDTNAGGAPEKVGDNLDHSRELVAIVADTNIELIGGFQKSQDTFWASVPVEINAQAVRCRFLVECNHCSVSHIFFLWLLVSVDRKSTRLNSSHLGISYA